MKITFLDYYEVKTAQNNFITAIIKNLMIDGKKIVVLAADDEDGLESRDLQPKAAKEVTWPQIKDEIERLESEVKMQTKKIENLDKKKKKVNDYEICR